ncbi:MAG: hypothetical protein AB1Z38_12635 [Desulfotignum sp.]
MFLNTGIFGKYGQGDTTWVRHRGGSPGLHVSGTGTVISGFLLWIRVPFNSNALFLISVTHGIFAVATTGLLGYFLLKIRRKNGPGQAQAHLSHQRNTKRDLHE